MNSSFASKALALAWVSFLVLPVSGSWAADTNLADALKTIQGKEMVDLTNTFGTSTPVWSGFGQMTMSAASDPKTHRP
jgi:hypothetical protein